MCELKLNYFGGNPPQKSELTGYLSMTNFECWGQTLSVPELSEYDEKTKVSFVSQNTPLMQLLKYHGFMNHVIKITIVK